YPLFTKLSIGRGNHMSSDDNVLAGFYTRQEIYSQPEAWQGVLEVLDGATGALVTLFERGDYEQVVFTGCGSTYYLSIAAAAVMQRVAGVPALGLPASEVWL